MSIFKISVTTEEWQKNLLSGPDQRMGLRVVEVGPDFIRAEATVTDEHVQPMGFLHGGISCMLAEGLASAAGNAVLAGTGQAAVGSQLSAWHLRPARSGETITLMAKPKHLGRKTQLWGIDIRNAGGKPVAEVNLSLSTIDLEYL